MKLKPSPRKQVFKPARRAGAVRLLTKRELPALWLVNATIGDHNHVEVTVPAPDIVQAGLKAGNVLEGTAADTFSRGYNYQIQSITQLP